MLRATGGGSYKHHALLRRVDGLVLDDDASMVSGLNFLLQRPLSEQECFECQVQDYSPIAAPAAYRSFAKNYRAVADAPRSYLYCSVGHGTTMLEVRGCDDGVTRYCRRGFSSVGGSTFWGLVQLLTSCSTFDEVIRLTERGSSSRVDMLVGDVYGGDYPEIGLRGDVIAASFGKVAIQREDTHSLGPKFLLRYLAALLRHWEECFWLVVLAVLDSLPFGLGQKLTWLSQLAAGRSASRSMSGNIVGGSFGTFHRAEDVALSLLRMVSNNIGHVACLHAQQHQLHQIVFGGSFIRDHPYTIATISSAVNFFGKGSVQALFLKHDGFVGAIGAHLSGLPIGGKSERMSPGHAAGHTAGRDTIRPAWGSAGGAPWPAPSPAPPKEQPAAVPVQQSEPRDEHPQRRSAGAAPRGEA